MPSLPGLRALPLVLPLLALLLAGPARATELSAFNAAVDAAMDRQRAALFYLRTGNPMVAEIELEGAREAWQGPGGALGRDAAARLRRCR